MSLTKRLLALSLFIAVLSGCQQNTDVPGDETKGTSPTTEVTVHTTTEETTEEPPTSEETSSSIETSSTAQTSSEIASSSEESTSSQVTDAPVNGDEYIGSLYTRSQLLAMDSTKNGYGPGVHVDADNRPAGAVVMQDRYGKYDADFIMPKSDNVYLTFDLGWENGYTAPILDTLLEKGVKGLFFVTMDYCRSSPDIIRRIIDEGHVLGNHSNHHYSMPTLTLEQMEAEIMDLHTYILDTYGYEMELFRPPMGEFSEQSLALTQSLGYRTVQWSFAYLDYDVNNQPAISDAYARVTGAVHGGAIYLIHAVSSTNDAILGDVIDDFRQKGFILSKYE